MKKVLVPGLFLLLSYSFSAQTGNSIAKKTTSLSPSVKYADVNNDDIVSLDEAKIVFESYQNYDETKMKKDLADDIESTVIELISYLEGVNCNDIKKSVASKRFIDVYYANKFFDIKDESFGLLIENLKASSREEPVIQAEEDDFPEIITTDRPDQTESPFLTPTGFFQVEAGTQSEYDNDKINKVNTQSTLYNTTLWKYGVTKNFELRLITEYAADKMQFKGNSDINDTVMRISGWNPISIGSKIALQKEKGIIPQISLITHLELPYLGSENYRPTTIIPRFRFLFAHTLSDRFSFSYNLGAEWEDGSSTSTGIYTATFGASLIGNLGMFVEAYGFLRENSAADNRLDGGFTYLLNNDIQLDCSGGIGLSEISPDYFISGGISFRFNAFNREHRKKN